MMNKLKTTKVHLLRFLFVLPVAVVMLLAFRNKYEQTKQTVPVLSGTAAQDTIPKARKAVPLPKEIESIVVMRMQDENEPANKALTGMVVVIRKDGKKELYDMDSMESRNDFEKKYGVKLEEVAPPPPPPPPPPAQGEWMAPPPPPANSGLTAPPPPATPAAPKLPASVKSIQINNDKAKVEFKNGKLEQYDLNNEEQRKKFEIKYGEFVAPPPPPPASENDLREVRVTERAIPVARAGVRVTPGEMTERPITTTAGTPLYVLNGVETTTAVVDQLPPQAIASVDVLKGEQAIAAYGKKAKDGAILIKTTAPSETRVVEEPITSAGVTEKELSRATVQNAELYRYGQNGLIIMDGKEVPADVKKLNGSFNIVTLTKEEAIKKYGEKGKNGAIEMTTIK